MPNKKKLTRSRTDRKICGVCGGLGEYVGVDSTVFRILFAALAICIGGGLLLYLAFALIMPEESVE